MQQQGMMGCVTFLAVSLEPCTGGAGVSGYETSPWKSAGFWLDVMCPG